jgi:hypothetical protein
METMRLPITLVLFASGSLFAQTSDEKDALATVQKTFDAMAAHDTATIRSLMLPDARLYSIRAGAASTATAVTGTAIEDFATRIGGTKGELLERFTAKPSVSIRGQMAQVWGEYEFLREGKFTHCGVDSVGLFKTPEGWKIATLAYTVEPTGCKGH